MSKAVLCLFLACFGVAAAEVVRVSGKGQVNVPPAQKKDGPETARRALAAAQELARLDAVTQAVYQVYGNAQKLGAQAQSVVRNVFDHSAAMILDIQVKSVDVQGGVAVTEVVLSVDVKALRDYLQDSLGLSITQEAEGKFKTYVLAYTVEGMDPNRTQPQVLREEVTDDRNNVHSSASASAQTDAASDAASYALDAAHSSSNQGKKASQSQGSTKYEQSANVNASGSQQGSLHLAGSRGSLDGDERSSAKVSGSAHEKVSADQSSRSAAEWNRQNSGRVNERASAASSSFHHAEDAKADFSDTSTRYHKLVVYADTTKKGAGGTNEVRAKLGEMLKTNGLATGFYDINLMGREFASEDDLYHEIIDALKRDPNIKPEDCVAVALNRLTPANPATHRYTSQVTYRLLRIADGELLLPDKNVIGDSGDQVSDDSARTVATEVAMNKASEVIPGEITRAIKQSGRADARAATSAAAEYLIRIDNVSNPGSTTGVKQVLRSAGFAVSTQFRGAASSESITVKLNGKTGAEVSAALESQLERYEVINLDDHGAILKAK